ncbi:MAG: O-antigen ligase family protein [Pseudomonadota bacterium]
MKRYSVGIDPKLVCLLIAIIVTTAFISGIMAKATAVIAFAVVMGLLVCVVSFANTDVALYILVFSMLLSPEFGQRTTHGSGMTFRVDDVLIVLIGFAWLARSALHKELGLFLKTPLNKPIFFYLAVCILSTAIGILVGNVSVQRGFFFVLKYFEYYVVYFMVVNHVRNEDQIRRLVIALLLTCLVIDIIGLLQIPSGERVTAPFEGERGEPNTLGGYLVLMLAMSLSLAVYVGSFKQKAALWILSGLSFCTLLFTQSRGSYLAFAVMYFSLMVLSKKKMFVVILVLALVSAPFVAPQQVKDRVAYTFTQQRMEGQKKIGTVTLDTSTSARLQSWQEGWNAFLKRPIFGCGVTGYGFMDAQLVRVLVETGIVGLFGFFILSWALLKEGWKSYQYVHSEFYKAICRGFFVGTVGMLAHSLSANTFIIVRIMEPFWCLAGIVMMSHVVEANAAHENAKDLAMERRSVV